MKKLKKKPKKIIFGTAFLIGDSDSIGFYVDVRVETRYTSNGIYYSSYVDIACKTGRLFKLKSETIIIDDTITIYGLIDKYKRKDLRGTSNPSDLIDDLYSNTVFSPEKREKLSVFLFRKYKKGEIKLNDVSRKVKELLG